MSEPKNGKFDVATFLSSAGLGRRIVQIKPKQAFFSQGNPADSVFYLQKGRAKLTVVSQSGKEATITLLLRRRLRRRGVARNRGRSAHGDCHSH